MRAYRLHDASWSRIVTHRVHRPDVIAERMLTRRRPESRVPQDGHLVLLACNHRIDPRSGTPVDRRELLDRIVEALTVAEIDGVIASADLIEELTLLNVLEHRLAFCLAAAGPVGTSSAGSTEARNCDTFAGSGFDGAMLPQRWGMSATSLATEVETLAAQQLPTVIELRVDYPQGASEFDTPWEDWAEQVHSASSVVSTGAGVWLSAPAVAGLNRIAEVSGFPLLVRDTDVPLRPAAWQAFFRAELPPTVRGMIPGLSALFPLEGSVGRATAAIAQAVRERAATA